MINEEDVNFESYLSDINKILQDMVLIKDEEIDENFYPKWNKLISKINNDMDEFLNKYDKYE